MPSGKYTTDHCRISIPTPLYRRLCATAAGRRISVVELLYALLDKTSVAEVYGEPKGSSIEKQWPPRGESFGDHD